MRGIIRVGDLLSHGGHVEAGAPNYTVMGRSVARKGDACLCALHGEVVIADGDDSFEVDGAAAAFEGHKASCGAELISSMPSSGRN
ncbi:PAAR domain-containing protein [Paraburkholderia sp. A2WS-5]|uniref:PAAR domain-containing protein n=1 Tax=unclassified Paraburkholderia TaxID=2615204 RepID=UPI003B81B69D